MASNDFENGVWRTVGGRRIFIRDGEDLSSAMKRSGKFKNKRYAKDVKSKTMDQYIEDHNKKVEEESLKDENLKTRDDAFRQAAKELGYKKHTSDEKQVKEIYERQQEIMKENPHIAEYENYKENAYRQAAKELGYKRHTSDEKQSKEIYERANELIDEKYGKKEAMNYMQDQFKAEEGKNPLFNKEEQYEIEGMGRISESDMKAEYNRLKKEGNIGSESYEEWRDDLVADPRSAVTKVSSDQKESLDLSKENDRFLAKSYALHDRDNGTISEKEYQNKLKEIDSHAGQKSSKEFDREKFNKWSNENSDKNIREYEKETGRDALHPNGDPTKDFSDYEKRQYESAQAKDFIKSNKSIQEAEEGYKWGERAIHQYKNASRAEKQNIKQFANEKIRNRNKAYEKAFEEYKKVHPNTRLSLRQFMNISEGK